MHTKSIFSSLTEQCLSRSGWFSGRYVPTDDFVERFLAEGYEPNSLLTDFLGSFAGLRVSHPAARAPGLEDYFHLDPIKAINGIYRERVSTYEERIGEKLCVFGEAFREHMVLMMSSTGAVYAAYEDVLVRVGSSGEDAIEALCTGRELEHIP